MGKQQPEIVVQRQRMAIFGGVAGAVLMFIVVDIMGELLKIAAGAAIGAALGVVVWAQLTSSRRRAQAEQLQRLPKANLEKQARQLDIDGATSMTKPELAEAIAAKEQGTDPTGEAIIGTIGAVAGKLESTAEHVKERIQQHNDNQGPQTTL